jgi:phosphohistidine swiveling domain-containing protein
LFCRDVLCGGNCSLAEAQFLIDKLCLGMGGKLIRDWNTLIALVELAASFGERAEALLHGVFMNLLLLKRSLNPRLGNDKGDLEYVATRLRRSLVHVLDTFRPTEDSYLLFATIVRLLPQINDEDRIGTIRALSERFDEDRDNPLDPYRTRANSLRKEIHQKPSEQNIALVEDYLAEQTALLAGTRSGTPDAPDMIEIAHDLLNELRRFWSVITDSAQIEQLFSALCERFPQRLAEDFIDDFGQYTEALRAGNFLKANAGLTLVRRGLKNLVMAPAPGAFRLAVLSFEVAAERLSFAYQSSLCDEVYRHYAIEDLARHIEILVQIVRSVRAFGGGNKQLGRTGILLDREAKENAEEVDSVRRIIKDILNITKQQTDFMKTRYNDLILSMLREWQPDLTELERDRCQIGVYNYFFRSSSFLHLGEFAAFLAGAVLPFADSRLVTQSETETGKTFWRFHGAVDVELPSHGSLRYLVGGKAASLLQMHGHGLPVPPGFSITANAGGSAYQGWHFLPGFGSELFAELQALEAVAGKQFGHPQNPLLVSVRSGAPVSMPGMMDTVLNIGLNEQILAARVTAGEDRSFWYDCYYHLIYMFARSIHSGVAMPKLDSAMRAYYRQRVNLRQKAEYFANMRDHLLALYWNYTGQDFPQDPREQLERAVIAVFRSWNSGRARDYRSIHHIPEHLGTGVTVQEMVFGNRDGHSCSGVYFTRDPETGGRGWGELVIGGQGEEVVSGQVQTHPVEDMKLFAPASWDEMVRIGEFLERTSAHPQDIEFVVDAGRLFVLQSRYARLTTRGKLFSLIDMVESGVLERSEALRELSVEALEDLEYPSFAQKDIDIADHSHLILSHGLGVFHGVAVGRAAFHIEHIIELLTQDPAIPCILIKEDTKPEDIEAMYKAAGCATRVGGPTSHAAINARVIGRPCVVNCVNLTMTKDEFDHIMEVRVNDLVIRVGDIVSIDGNRALLIAGPLPVQPHAPDPRVEAAARIFRGWEADQSQEVAGDEAKHTDRLA